MKTKTVKDINREMELIEKELDKETDPAIIQGLFERRDELEKELDDLILNNF